MCDLLLLCIELDASNLGGRRCGGINLAAAFAVDGFQGFQLLGLGSDILLPFLGRYFLGIIMSPHHRAESGVAQGGDETGATPDGNEEMGGGGSHKRITPNKRAR